MVFVTHKSGAYFLLEETWACVGVLLLAHRATCKHSLQPGFASAHGWLFTCSVILSMSSSFFPVILSPLAFKYGFRSSTFSLPSFPEAASACRE